MNRVQILCAVGNNPSRQIPIRLGFHLEGIVKEGNYYLTGISPILKCTDGAFRVFGRGSEREQEIPFRERGREREAYFMDENGSRKRIS